MTLPTANYSILTPWLLPPGNPKKPNAGDGFILDSTEKLIGSRASHYFSSRAPLSDADIETINGTACLVVAGANTLRDDFAPTPGFTLQTLEKLKVPVILVGLGHYGAAAVTQGLHLSVVKLLTAILERFPCMSVRCDKSWQYVVRSAPHLKDKVFMTSCPVAYPLDRIAKPFTCKQEYDQLVVTITDRTRLAEQMPILEQAPKYFSAKRRVLALHQDYGNTDLKAFAQQQGYEVFSSTRYQDYLALYEASDAHIGNRLHAHLKSLSLGNVSFLMPFDLRQVYFAESLDFPLITALPSPEIAQYDFTRFTTRRDAALPTMLTVISAIRALL
jgi:hypothetical protein